MRGKFTFKQEKNFFKSVSTILRLNIWDFDFFDKPKTHTKQVSKLTVVDGEKQQKTATKAEFSQFNDKRFYFSEFITSLHLSHPYLKN